jgi:hypothetical protein
MKKIALAIMVASMLSAPPLALANENSKSVLNRNDYSWNWKTPGERSVQQTQLLIWCQKNPDKCVKYGPGGPGGTGGDGGGSGFGVGGIGANATAIGNQNVIVIDGDGNTITFEANQDNSGDQSAWNEIRDNNLDMEINADVDMTNVKEVNGDVIDTDTTTTTTTTTTNKTFDIDVHDVDVTKGCCGTME